MVFISGHDPLPFPDSDAQPRATERWPPTPDIERRPSRHRNVPRIIAGTARTWADTLAFSTKYQRDRPQENPVPCTPSALGIQRIHPDPGCCSIHRDRLGALPTGAYNPPLRLTRAPLVIPTARRSGIKPTPDASAVRTIAPDCEDPSAYRRAVPTVEVTGARRQE